MNAAQSIRHGKFEITAIHERVFISDMSPLLANGGENNNSKTAAAAAAATPSSPTKSAAPLYSIRPVCELKNDTEFIRVVAASSDGGLVAAATNVVGSPSSTSTIVVYSLTSEKRIALLKANTGKNLDNESDDVILGANPICSLEFSPNSRLLAGATTAGNIYLWDLSKLPSAGNNARDDYNVDSFFQSATLRIIHAVKYQTGTANLRGIQCCVSFSKDGTLLLATFGTTIMIFDTVFARPIYTAQSEGMISASRFVTEQQPQSTSSASSSASSVCIVMFTSILVGLGIGHVSEIVHGVFTPSTAAVATLSASSTGGTQQQQQHYTFQETSKGRLSLVDQATTFSPCGRFFLFQTKSKSVCLIDVENDFDNSDATAQQQRKLTAHDKAVLGMCFAPLGEKQILGSSSSNSNNVVSDNLIATCSPDCSLRIWRDAECETVGQKNDSLLACAFAGDCATVVAVTDEKSILVSRILRGKLLNNVNVTMPDQVKSLTVAAGTTKLTVVDMRGNRDEVDLSKL